jgi:cysteine synthase A
MPKASSRSTKVLIVAGLDFGAVAYRGLERARKGGCVLYLLCDGSFQPRPGMFERVFACNLKRTSETLEFMRGQPERFDAVVTLFSDWLTTLVALLAQDHGCRGNSPLCAFRCRSKYHMRQALRAAGVPSPDFRLCRSFEDIREAVAAIGTPCVAKPIGGHMSVGVFMIRDRADLASARENYEKSIRYATEHEDEVFFDFTPDEYRLLGVPHEVNMQTDYLVEEYLDGHEVSADALVRDGKVTVIGIEDQIRMQSPYFVQIAGRLPYLCPPDERRAIRRLVTQTVHAMGIRDSATHTEIMFTSQGPKIVEIGCRVGGDDLHDTLWRVTGVNMMYEVIQVALGVPRRYRIGTKTHTAMRFFLPEKGGIVTAITIAPGLKEAHFLGDLEIHIQPGHRVAPPPESFEYMGYVSVHGNTSEEAWKHLDVAHRSVSFDIR